MQGVVGVRGTCLNGGKLSDTIANRSVLLCFRSWKVRLTETRSDQDEASARLWNPEVAAVENVPYELVVE